MLPQWTIKIANLIIYCLHHKKILPFSWTILTKRWSENGQLDLLPKNKRCISSSLLYISLIFFGQWKSQSDEEDVVCRRVHSHVSRRARSTYSARPVTSFMRPLAQRRKKDGAIFFAAHLKNIVHSHDIYCNLPNLSQFICSTGSYSYLHSFPWPVLRCGATAAIYL